MKKSNPINPFAELLYEIKTRVRPSYFAKGETVSVVDDDTGEIRGRGFNAVIHEKHIDTERFVKLYAKGYEVLPKLSIPASKVLWFLIRYLGYDDVITLNMDKALKETGYKSEAVIYRAISELKKHDIIANAYRNGMYYVNPTMFYRGNRLKLMITKKGE